MESKRYCLRHPYFSIKTQNDCSFGGSQTWSASRMMRKYGCGVVGMADVLLYLGLHQTSCETDLLYGMLREDGFLSYPRYERYLIKMRRRYLSVIPGFGVPGFFLPMAMNRYFRHYRNDLRAAWCLRPGKILPRIEEMLRQDIPVILAIGPNFPMFWGRRRVPFYRKENGEYLYATETKAHFVVVTGMMDGYLQISSWGKEYYLPWAEYQKYVKKYSTCLTSNICRIRPKRRWRRAGEKA